VKYEYMSSVLLPYYMIQNQKLIRNLASPSKHWESKSSLVSGFV